MSGPPDEEDLAALPLGAFLERTATNQGAPAAGSAAAVAAALGAALAGMTARLSRELDGADRLAEHADTLRARALELAEADAAAVGAMLSGSSPDRPDPNDVPRAIGDVADELAGLAADLARDGNPRLHADAVAAGHLATAARAMVDGIIRSNRDTAE